METDSLHFAAVNDLFYGRDWSGNIAWELTELSEFAQVLPALIENEKKRGGQLIYVQFSGQPLLPAKMNGVRAKPVRLTYHFESFTVAVCRVLSEIPEGSLVIFDSLSELQTAWATDLMMENFFLVVTPLIHKKKCRAFYPLMRGRHSVDAMERIRAHADGMIESFSDFKNVYLRIRDAGGPQGNPNALPCVFDPENGLAPIQDGPLLGRFHKAMGQSGMGGPLENMDSWDRFFNQVQRKFEAGEDVSKDCGRMCEIMMSRDPRIRQMIRKHFRPEDYFFVKEHMVGTGLIGGKACGMLTARKIVENTLPEVYDRMEPHNSFFIGSDVFYSYIVENGIWDMRVAQKKPENYFALADELADQLMHGTFSEKMEAAFIRMLEFYGPSPVIVRSSSILEDGFGNAFAGKYESVFCAGRGSLRERLEEFEHAIRVVYASTLSRSALDYRLRRGLSDKDEQMALLVMRVSGSRFGSCYLPCAAGVGYSYSTYRFLDSLDPKAGMLRLVMGLGTTAVDRVEGSYPRLVSLDRPEATPYTTQADHHRYSQKNIQLINEETGTLEQVPFGVVAGHLPKYLKNVLLDHDRDAERRFMDRGMYRDVLYVSCGGLVKNRQLMEDMRRMMQAVQEEYGQPVDIEYTINLDEDGTYIINLLQCRPLQVFRDRRRVTIPSDLPKEKVFLDCRHTSMGQSGAMDIDAVVYVDPMAYYNMPYQQKGEVAKAIGKINWYFRDKNMNLVLMVPGRVGTSSPELGVPTAFSDISAFRAIFEVAESKAGYNPELSYGSHIFQDLVENEILYMAVFEDKRTACFRPEKVTALKNALAGIDPEMAGLAGVMGLYDTRGKGCRLYHDLLEEHLVCVIGIEEGNGRRIPDGAQTNAANEGA